VYRQDVRHGGKGDGRNVVAEDILGPSQGAGGRHLDLARNQSQIAAFARSKHKSMRPQTDPAAIDIGRSVSNPKLSQASNLHCGLARRAGAPDGLARWAGRRPIPAPSILQFAIEQRRSSKSYVDLMRAPV